jgi:hypothetical protein
VAQVDVTACDAPCSLVVDVDVPSPASLVTLTGLVHVQCASQLCDGYRYVCGGGGASCSSCRRECLGLAASHALHHLSQDPGCNVSSSSTALVDVVLGVCAACRYMVIDAMGGSGNWTSVEADAQSRDSQLLSVHVGNVTSPSEVTVVVQGVRAPPLFG